MKGYYLRFWYRGETILQGEGSFEVIYLPTLITTVSKSYAEGLYDNLFLKEMFSRMIGSTLSIKDIAFKFEEPYYMAFPLVVDDPTKKLRSHPWIKSRLTGGKITPYWNCKYEKDLVNSIEDLKTLVSGEETLKGILYQDQLEFDVPEYFEIIAAVE